ncbi:ABC transporter substrate-binding protein [Streptomyces longwoodensis]|uniref:ABC transporter substrate-binding protein n=1 Tax=Streptomyces longwoodensis TaxID=68231 RepID=UPI0037F82445
MAADDTATNRNGPHPSGASAAGRGRRRQWSSRRRAVALIGLTAVVGLAAVLLPRLWTATPEPVYLALVTSQTGPGAPRSPEIARGVRFHVDQVNSTGGMGGHPVRLLLYDDQADPDGARRTAQRIARDDRVALVIGNTNSPTALAAAPVYAAAHLPFITPTATADAVTRSPWAFRATYTNSYQGSYIAAYARQVLGARTATVLSSVSAYGTTLADGFHRAFVSAGGTGHAVALDDTAGQRRTRQLQQALKAVREDAGKGPVILALPEGSALSTLAFLRSHGVTNDVIGGDDLSNDEFSQSLAHSAQERARPGSMTGHYYAASPQLADSLTGAALDWATDYRDHYGSPPNWKALSGQTAADMAVHALLRSDTPHGRVTVRERTAVRDALAAMNTPSRALDGVYGDRVYFDSSRSLHRPVTFGVVQDGRTVSAPVQLTESAPEHGVEPAGGASTPRPAALGLQQIVYMGINVNTIGAFDTKESTFKADFFLWLRYTGSDQAANIAFTNIADEKFALPPPVRQAAEGTMKYRLYQIATTFRAPLDFHRFPFDRQHLRITVQNRTQPTSRVVYVVDRPLVDQDRAEALRSGQDVKESVDGMPNWSVHDLSLYKAAVGSTARLGDPDLARARNGVYYAQYVADVTVARDVPPFLVKNLLPLLLSVVVTYATLFFPRDPRYTSTRVSLEVTAMLGAAVLLTNVTGSLPDIGYVVALEWVYYAFMFLVGTCVFISLAGAWLQEHDNVTAWNRLARVSRIYYPVFCLAVLLVYLVHFG